MIDHPSFILKLLRVELKKETENEFIRLAWDIPSFNKTTPGFKHSGKQLFPHYTHSRHVDMNGRNHIIPGPHQELIARIGLTLRRIKILAMGMRFTDAKAPKGARLTEFTSRDLDGRPMSGDIGKGATKEAVEFAARMAADRNCPPGFLQLAGGTNSHTIDVLKRIGLFQTTSISGVAYGGYARKVVGKILHKMFLLQDSHPASLHIEQFPCYLLEALEEAVALVGPIKSYGVPRSIYLEY